LVERLNAGLDRKLTLLSASAGFGKTTLLGEWVSESAMRAARRLGLAGRTRRRPGVFHLTERKRAKEVQDEV